MEKWPQPNLPFAGTKERYEKWEKEPVAVVNILKEMGLPSLQNIEKAEITPKEAIDIDNEALRNPDCANVVYGRPHAGEFMPRVLWEKATKEGKKTLAIVDRGTDKIFRSETIPSVGTKISRFIVDPNRAPLLGMKLSNPKIPGEVLWYKGGFNEDIYQEGQEPNKAEVENLVERFYLPYYNGMMGIIGSLADRKKSPKERVLIIDGHSFSMNEIFRPYYKKYNVDTPEDLPMFILGDADGETCDKNITESFMRSLKKNFEALDEAIKKELMNGIGGGLIGVNNPFKGARNVHFYGQRGRGINSFQLECNEAAYVDEKEGNYYNAVYKEKNVEIIQKLIKKTCEDIDPVLKHK